MYRKVFLVVLLQVLSARCSLFNICSSPDVKLIKEKCLETVETESNFSYNVDFESVLFDYELKVKEITSILRENLNNAKIYKNFECVNPLETVFSNLEDKIKFKFSEKTKIINEKLQHIQNSFEYSLSSVNSNRMKRIETCTERTVDCRIMEDCCENIWKTLVLLKQQAKAAIDKLHRKYANLLYEITEITIKIATYLNTQIGDCFPQRSLLSLILKNINQQIAQRRPDLSEEVSVESNESVNSEELFDIIKVLKNRSKYDDIF